MEVGDATPVPKQMPDRTCGEEAIAAAGGAGGTSGVGADGDAQDAPDGNGGGGAGLVVVRAASSPPAPYGETGVYRSAEPTLVVSE